MGNRGQKRPEMVEELPADKRACSSLDFRPSSSNSSAQTQMNSTNSNSETQDHDMDTSSSASASSRSEGDHEKESAYGSCDSDDMDQHHSSLREYQRQRSYGDHGKFRKIISNLSEATDPSAQLAVLTELCEVLSFCTESSLSTMISDSLSPHLTKLARHESNPEIMLLAIRAITYICDVYPRSSGFLVRHDAVPALCQQLMTIEYLDVAEQCLQALEKISREQPLACLQAGAVMAVLNYIDFFSTSMQRVALSTVVNICKKLPSECPAPFMEAVPLLCNLLQYEDRQLVENVATCLIKIVERVSQSSEALDGLCNHGLIHQVIHMIKLNGRTTLSQPIYNGLIGLLVKLSSGSILAFKSLYELNISSVLKDMLSSFDLSHGISSHLVFGHCDQVYEVLKLLNHLLTSPIKRDDDDHLASEKESFLVSHPEFIRKFGVDLLPFVIQVFNSGVNSYVSYGCLSVLNKLICLSKSDILIELLKNANISSFLAGVFTRKDQHLQLLALQIVDLILQKFSHEFLNSFIKEGVFFAIDAILTPDRCSQLIYPALSGIQLVYDPSQKYVCKESMRCLCYAFSTGRPPAASESGCCKIEKESVCNLAKHVQETYLSPELFDSEKGLTDVLRELRVLSTSLNDLISLPLDNYPHAHHEEKLQCILHQIMEKLTGKELISTFEFIESGIAKSFVNYLSCGVNIRAEGNLCGFSVVEKRFETLAVVFSSGSELLSVDLPLLVLTRNLQSALGSLENFPVILSHGSRQRSSFATVPHGRSVPYPCLKVRFMKEEQETSLNDHSGDVLSVDPFATLDAIAQFVLSRARTKSSNHNQMSSHEVVWQTLESQLIGKSFPVVISSQSGSLSTDLPSIKVGEPNLFQLPPDQLKEIRDANSGEASSNETHNEAMEQGLPITVEEKKKEVGQLSSCSNKATENLVFSLEGEQLLHSLTLYQAILQQLMKQNEVFSGSKLWSQVYTLSYKRALEPAHDVPSECSCSAQCLSSDKSALYMEYTSFCDIFASEIASDLEKSSPVYDVLLLIKSLEHMNRLKFPLLSRQRLCAFAEGKINDLDDLRVNVSSVAQSEFVSSKLTEKLEQQMQDSLAVCNGSMPVWCNQLVASCPFLFSFEARSKYFRLAAFSHAQVHSSHLSPYPRVSNERRASHNGLIREKFLVYRDRILDSAKKMMDLHGRNNVIIEVEFDEEVGTGLGPTLEFYTLVCHEFQKCGLGMWRGDMHSGVTNSNLHTDSVGILLFPCGLFPRPWSSFTDISDGIFSEVLKNYVLLGKVVAKALQDSRLLDLHFSKAFYKLILGQELSLYDIHSFDPKLGRTLLEFQALVCRKRYLESMNGDESCLESTSCFRNTTIEDLCIDFTLPGYPDIFLTSGSDHTLVNMGNLEEYISLVVDATVKSGISRQVEAFKSGFNQVFPVEQLKIFNEEELERLLCGERDSWALHDLVDHIKFDHGYTSSSTPVVNLLEVIREFDYEQRRAFLQFVTGAPRLPPGGLAALNPKLTVVQKHCSNQADIDLPSVMTCANYLKLPPYSSKERMKEKLLYAITEGQGSFHLS